MKILLIIITLLNLSNIYASTNNWDGYVQTQPALAKYTLRLEVIKKEREECIKSNTRMKENFLSYSEESKRSATMLRWQNEQAIKNIDIETKSIQDILNICHNHYLKTHPQTNNKSMGLFYQLKKTSSVAIK